MRNFAGATRVCGTLWSSLPVKHSHSATRSRPSSEADNVMLTVKWMAGEQRLVGELAHSGSQSVRKHRGKSLLNHQPAECSDSNPPSRIRSGGTEKPPGCRTQIWTGRSATWAKSNFWPSPFFQHVTETRKKNNVREREGSWTSRTVPCLGHEIVSPALNLCDTLTQLHAITLRKSCTKSAH